MDLSDVKEKMSKKNKILFSRDSSCLQELLQLLRKQNHRTIVLWAFECVKEPVQLLKERYPDEKRPQNVVDLCKEWAKGKIKMPIAKKAILEVHALAKELDNPVDIALCHAVGQGCSAVHVETHAIGLVFYELTALVREYGFDDCEKIIEEKINGYIYCLKQCEKKINDESLIWASFLLKDKENKEKLLYEKGLSKD